MGLYHSINFINSKGEESEIQFKNAGEYDPISMEIGDRITTSDGIHFDHGGCFVVAKGVIVAAFDEGDDPLHTKWGHSIPFPDLSEINPIAVAVNKLSQPNQQEAGGWVAVQDGLPEDGNVVLCYEPQWETVRDNHRR
jgi:hypothetical protein